MTIFDYMLDYTRLKYRLDEVNNKDLFTKYPELEEIYYEALIVHGKDNADHAPLNKKQLMSFVIYSYDINSPISREPSIHKRRHAALELLEFKLQTEQDFDKNKDLVQFIKGDNLFVNRLSIHYCKLQNSFDWSELCSLQDILDDVDYTLKSESAGAGNKSANEMLKIKLDIREKSKSTRNEMRVLANNIFAADVKMLDYVAAYQILEKRKAIITPERYMLKTRPDGEA